MPRMKSAPVSEAVGNPVTPASVLPRREAFSRLAWSRRASERTTWSRMAPANVSPRRSAPARPWTWVIPASEKSAGGPWKAPFWSARTRSSVPTSCSVRR